MIVYEWDENKYFKNLEKHNVDFLDAKFIYECSDKITLSVNQENEIRYME
jgi:uncharacterized DUF497 family protein